VPELPEVETMVRGIRPFVEGREILAVRSCRCACKPLSMTPALSQLARQVRSERVASAGRLGKRIVLTLGSGASLVFEPRMTGLMLLADPPDRAHLRLELRFSGEREYNSVWFWDRRGLGTVRLFAPGELEQKLGEQTLGPDALHLTAQDWHARLTRTRRPIKVALLDQKLAAGIGNLYASEILHVARIHPAHPAHELTRPQSKRLHAAVQAVLTEAILHEGSTLGDATYRTALNQSGRYQNAHRVYDRAHEPCRTCGRGQIERIVQAQRSTFFCARCQRQ
jgi:formamidopyrimidine-DNA glycosylase